MFFGESHHLTKFCKSIKKCTFERAPIDYHIPGIVFKSLMLLRSLNSIHHIIFSFVIQVRLAKRSLVYYFWRWCCRCTSCSNCWSGINCMLVDFPPKGHTNQNSIQSPSSTYGLLSWIYQAHAAASKINDSVLIFWYAPCKCSAVPEERHLFISKHWLAPCISIGIFITDQANPSTQFSSILVITS